jgi:flagellar biogenesis protein FliO
VSWFDHFLAISFVFVLLMGAVWALRRRATRGGTSFFSYRSQEVGQLRLSGRLPLTHQHCLYLIEVAGRMVVVATFPGGLVFEPGRLSQNDCLLPQHRERA